MSRRGRRSADAAGSPDGRSTPRADQVLEEIRTAIRDGRYRPGERIREAEVAERLGVSRTPVREALRRLETIGLVQFEPWRGVIVAALDRQQVSELYAMREVLEGAAARLAAKHIGEAEGTILKMLLARAGALEGDAEALAKVNRQFHATIYAAARNRYLTQTLAQLRDALALLRGTTYAVPCRAQEAADEHCTIVRAILDGDPDAAESAARAHIAGAQRARLVLLMEEETAS